MRRRPPRSPLFPYTTLFRSCEGPRGDVAFRASEFSRLLSQTSRRRRSRNSSWRSVGRGLLRVAHPAGPCAEARSEEHTSELQSHSDLVCRLLLEKKKKICV